MGRMSAPCATIERMGDNLTEDQKAIIDFAARWWKYAGAQEQAIRDDFEISGTRFWQLLNELLDEPAALAYDPVTINRYRRMRDQRARARSMRRLLHN